MLVLFLIMITSLATSMLLPIVGYMMMPKMSKSEMHAAPVECGFSQRNSGRNSSISVHFFLFGIIFLVFDLELLVVFPMISTINSFFSIASLLMVTFFIMFMLATLLWEWQMGSLSWLE